MAERKFPLFERLPEIYRVEDGKISPAGQLEHFLAIVESVFGEIEADIEGLYRNLFIDTCDPWVIPYIADLLGVSHLFGDSWTLRADVADAIALRRRKGTLGSIERLTYNLTQWGVHCVELRDRLVWNHHLNHQRPDEGGEPPYGEPSIDRFVQPFGGVATLRDPATLSLVGTPFDPLHYTVDAKPPSSGTVRYNLPNLAIFLWRLEDHRVSISKPVSRGVVVNAAANGTEATHVARFDIHPMGDPIQLFNTYRFDPEREPPIVTGLDETPNPIPMARLSQGSPSGRPERYVSVETYDPDDFDLDAIDISDCGLQFHIPTTEFDGEAWPAADASRLFRLHLNHQGDLDRGEISERLRARFEDEEAPLASSAVVNGWAPRWEITHGGLVRYSIVKAPRGLDVYENLVWVIRGARLCAWEEGLYPSVRDREIAIDPRIGRVVIGTGSEFDTDGEEQANCLKDHLLVTYTYGAGGPVGAHPISRKAAPLTWNDEPVKRLDVDYHSEPDGLQIALELIAGEGEPYLIEIHDSMTHELNIEAIDGVLPDADGMSYPLAATLIIRAADGQRPVIRLSRPLRFRATDPGGAGNVDLRIEGLYLTRDEDQFPVDAGLIERAALNRLEIVGCTLDPGGCRILDGTDLGGRKPMRASLRLTHPYGFSDPEETESFRQVPEIVLERSTVGPLIVDRQYRLHFCDTIVDGGPDVPASSGIAVANATDSDDDWGPPTEVHGLTVLGSMRIERIHGEGGIWVGPLQVLNNQVGCIRYSYFSGIGDRLPQNLGCVSGLDAVPRIGSEVFGEPSYGQLSLGSDFEIRERGPRNDEMGAFGFLLNAHKLRNLQIRYREFMPVGVRPLLVPVT